MPFQSLTFNTINKAKTEKLHGREFFVAPAVMITEGVHKGSQGPILYDSKFLSKNPEAWDHKPIVVKHPKNEAGEFISASDKNVLDSSGVGFLLNTKYDRKGKRWKTTCWFDKEQTKRVDKRVYNALQNGEVTEVSTGMFLKMKPEKGVYNGSRYKIKALQCKTTDHLAILPDEEGACSVSKGAGLLVNSKMKLKGWRAKDRRTVTVNQASFSQIGEWVRAALSAKYNQPGYSWNGFVHEIFDTYFVYCIYGGSPSYKYTYYKQEYTINESDSQVELVGDPTEVEPKTSYVEVVTNSFTTEEEIEMAKAVTFDRNAHLTSLIANGFDESDKVWLSKLKDEELQKIKPASDKIIANTKGPDDDDDGDDDEKPVVNKKKGKKPVVNKEEDEEEEPVVNNKKTSKFTFSEFIANADPETKEFLEDLKALKAQSKDEKAEIVKRIVANEANEYTEAELNEFKLPRLRKMEALINKLTANAANPKVDWDDEESWGSIYVGQNTAQPVTNSGEKENRFLTPPSAFVANGESDDEDDEEVTDRQVRRRKVRSHSEQMI